MMIDRAKQIRDAILEDVTDRRGWRQKWEQFDEDVQEEIKQTWLRIILEVLVTPEKDSI